MTARFSWNQQNRRVIHGAYNSKLALNVLLQHSQVRRGGCAPEGKSRSYLGRAQTGMSGANVSPIGRNDKVMPGANVSPIGRNKEEWFLSRTAITGGFRPGNHPGAADKTSPRHPS